MRLSLTLPLLLCAAHAYSQTDETSPQQVLVTGKQTDVEVGQEAIAGKVIIGKQRITDSGVQNVGELLRREPAISISKDGRLGLLGLPGYTQILVDGQTPQGDSLGLDLVHVERIEILKSTSAATGPIGIAGTINIVRRKTERKAFTRTSVGANTSNGRIGANLSWLNNQIAADKPLIYNVTLSARRSKSSNDSRYFETRHTKNFLPTLEFDGNSSSSSMVQATFAASEFVWTLTPEHKIVFSPDAGRFQSPASSAERRRWVDGRDLSVSTVRSDTMDIWSLPVRWDWRVNDNSALTLQLRSNDQRRQTYSSYLENWTGTPSRLRKNGQDDRGRNRFADLDFHTTLASAHEISAGGKIARNHGRQKYADTVNDQPDINLEMLGRELTTRLDSGRLFLQDDWRIDRSLAISAGLSVERRVYTFDEGFSRARAEFNMWSPSMHFSKRIDGDRRRQLRLSLARSFQPPEISQMLLRPSFDRFAACEIGGCGANDIDTADRTGNPRLQPERSLGLNLSYAYGLGKSSEIMVEWYNRAIQKKIGWEYALDNVPWAIVPRHVVRPVNLGGAEVRGFNLEGRLAGKDLAKELSALEAHGSLGFAYSKLSDLAGPSNRIAGQVPWRIKFGGSYTLKTIPLKFGLEANMLPGEWVRDGVSQRIYQSSKAALNLNVNWQVDAKSKFTANFDNLLHKVVNRVDEFQVESALLRLTTDSSDYSRISVKFDKSF